MIRTIIVLFTFIILSDAHAWKNGQAGNASTNKPTECSSPPYSTHDWIAAQALNLLPSTERI